MNTRKKVAEVVSANTKFNIVSQGYVESYNNKSMTKKTLDKLALIKATVRKGKDEDVIGANVEIEAATDDGSHYVRVLIYPQFIKFSKFYNTMKRNGMDKPFRLNFDNKDDFHFSSISTFANITTNSEHDLGTDDASFYVTGVSESSDISTGADGYFGSYYKITTTDQAENSFNAYIITLFISDDMTDLDRFFGEVSYALLGK